MNSPWFEITMIMLVIVSGAIGILNSYRPPNTWWMVLANGLVSIAGFATIATLGYFAKKLC